MNKLPEGERIIKYTPTDLLGVRLHLITLTPKVVTEEQVRAFCGGCDNLKPDNSCDPINDQTRYVAALNCSWAKVRGVRGRMTIEGFIGPSNPENSKTPTP